MRDSFNRNITYLRISVTDLCNNRCKYCMPSQGVEKRSHSEILTYEEIVRIAETAAELGITKVRITGGEPLVRKGIVGLIEKISAIDGISDIGLTTNGTLLPKLAKPLKAAGLKRINISLDTFCPKKYTDITRGGDIQPVLEGIYTASEIGLSPVKLNVVAMKGFNDDEICDFANLTADKPIDVRFIELMPIGSAHTDLPYSFMSAKEIRKEIKKKTGELIPCFEKGSVASYYQIPGAKGRIGFISPISNHFCNQCNKIRLTSEGYLKPCLHTDQELDLRPALKSGDKELLKSGVIHAIMLKPEKHLLFQGATPIKREMNRIGG